MKEQQLYIIEWNAYKSDWRGHFTVPTGFSVHADLNEAAAYSRQNAPAEHSDIEDLHIRHAYHRSTTVPEFDKPYGPAIAPQQVYAWPVAASSIEGLTERFNKSNGTLRLSEEKDPLFKRISWKLEEMHRNVNNAVIFSYPYLGK